MAARRRREEDLPRVRRHSETPQTATTEAALELRLEQAERAYAEVVDNFRLLRRKSVAKRPSGRGGCPGPRARGGRAGGRARPFAAGTTRSRPRTRTCSGAGPC